MRSYRQRLAIEDMPPAAGPAAFLVAFDPPQEFIEAWGLLATRERGIVRQARRTQIGRPIRRVAGPVGGSVVVGRPQMYPYNGPLTDPVASSERLGHGLLDSLFHSQPTFVLHR